MIGYNLLISFLGIYSVLGASYSPTLDISNTNQLVNAATSALKNLLTYYSGSDGSFDQADTPWHESGMIWGMFMDYAQYTGDAQFSGLVTSALVNSSFKTAHDFLGGNQGQVVEQFLGRWNDDVLWPNLAVIAGAELFGPKAQMAGGNGDWISLATKTYDQVWAQADYKCGGGIYWSRNRQSKGGNYKSFITQVEFISQGARNFIQTKNATAFEQSKIILDWTTTSGIANQQSGVIWDGVEADACGKFSTSLWSYNYGQMLGSLAWMYKATGEKKYLDMATPYFDYGARTFAGSNTSGIITEQCEADKTCNRDQQGFKAVYVRNLAYLYRITNNQTMKAQIQNMIDTSVKAMVDKSCDQAWNCGGNWTQDTQPIKYVRSQHVSAALLVAAIGVHGNQTNAVFSNQASTFNSTGSGRAAVQNAKSAAQAVVFSSCKWILPQSLLVILLSQCIFSA
ncbi:hydrolase 76 protein [Puccinia graminis f. sp. tritici]|uniref:Mannan endo-1,6-alpha-mannosidase n=1 Tax=Puccinia graminis f. sp. tritici TaxID=56615 RepID=A0A5B0QB59_PUCGR|nr:hydrolase 76 protein [Puccinia graminis f. sp. tritici]